MKPADYADYVVHDLLSRLDGVEARAMFGGHGLYRGGVIFGLLADAALYFKADAVNRPDYEARGSRPFTYEAKGGKKAVMSYWEVPADIAEDAELIAEWAIRSVEASRRKDRSKTSVRRQKSVRGKRE